MGGCKLSSSRSVSKKEGVFKGLKNDVLRNAHSNSFRLSKTCLKRTCSKADTWLKLTTIVVPKVSALDRFYCVELYRDTLIKILQMSGKWSPRHPKGGIHFV